MKVILTVWLFAHAWQISIMHYLGRHGANWWRDFNGGAFWRDVRQGWQYYLQFLRSLTSRWETQAMDFALHLGTSLLAALLGCMIARLFFNFGRGGLYPFAALLMGITLVSCAAYVLVVMMPNI